MFFSEPLDLLGFDSIVGEGTITQLVADISEMFSSTPDFDAFLIDANMSGMLINVMRRRIDDVRQSIMNLLVRTDECVHGGNMVDVSTKRRLRQSGQNAVGNFHVLSTKVPQVFLDDGQRWVIDGTQILQLYQTGGDVATVLIRSTPTVSCEYSKKLAEAFDEIVKVAEFDVACIIMGLKHIIKLTKHLTNHSNRKLNVVLKIVRVV